MGPCGWTPGHGLGPLFVSLNRNYISTQYHITLPSHEVTTIATTVGEGSQHLWSSSGIRLNDVLSDYICDVSSGRNLSSLKMEAPCPLKLKWQGVRPSTNKNSAVTATISVMLLSRFRLSQITPPNGWPVVWCGGWRTMFLIILPPENNLS